MNREIKFRAWDIQQKKMVYDGDEWLPTIYRGYNEHSYPVTVTSSGIYYTKKLNDEQQNDYYIDVHKGAKFVGSFYREWEAPALYHSNDNIILMQNTGLKDRNIKENYYQDIIKNRLTGLLCILEYGHYRGRTGTGFGWYLSYIDGELYIPYPYSLDEWEIFGNIYENIELIK